MRIYFGTATENIKHNYTPIGRIHQLVLDFGHTHTTNWYRVENGKILPINHTTKTAENIKNEIIKSDLMIAEISIPSFGLGYHVCLAKMYQIPVICLYHVKYKENISPTLKSMVKSNFILAEYDDSTLEKILGKSLKQLTPQKTRFNFNLSQKYYQYLNILAKETNKTKTEIIHNLIAEKFEHDNSQ